MYAGRGEISRGRAALFAGSSVAAAQAGLVCHGWLLCSGRRGASGSNCDMTHLSSNSTSRSLSPCADSTARSLNRCPMRSRDTPDPLLRIALRLLHARRSPACYDYAVVCFEVGVRIVAFWDGSCALGLATYRGTRCQHHLLYCKLVIAYVLSVS